MTTKISKYLFYKPLYISEIIYKIYVKQNKALWCAVLLQKILDLNINNKMQ